MSVCILSNSYEQCQATADWLLSKIQVHPTVAIVCGSGLGGLADILKDPQVFNYSDIPNFPQSTGVSAVVVCVRYVCVCACLCISVCLSICLLVHGLLAGWFLEHLMGKLVFACRGDSPYMSMTASHTACSYAVRVINPYFMI